MKMRDHPQGRGYEEVVLSDGSPRLGFVANPTNRHERRARAAQERAIKRALARGEEPQVFIAIDHKAGKNGGA